MLSRKTHDEKGIFLPQKWKDDVLDLLESVYGKECEESGKKFEVYGLTYPTEVLVIISLLDKADETASPITYSASADLEKNKQPKKIFDHLIDSVGVFFDDYFQGNGDTHDYPLRWTEAKVKGTKFFYKVSRENIALYLKANEILGEAD